MITLSSRLLKGIRGRYGDTQRKMANKLGVSVILIAVIEGGKQPLSKVTASKVIENYSLTEEETEILLKIFTVDKNKDNATFSKEGLWSSGELLREIRNRNLETQICMAKKLGLSNNYINKVENGKLPMTKGLCKRLISRYKLTVEEEEYLTNLFTHKKL